MLIYKCKIFRLNMRCEHFWSDGTFQWVFLIFISKSYFSSYTVIFSLHIVFIYQHLGVIGFLGSQTICHQVFKFVARFLFMSNVNRIFFQNCLLHTRSFYCVYQSWEVFALALPPHHWLCQGVRGYIGIDSNHFKMASQKHKLLIGIKYSLKVT